jgi:hypothetical protein
MQPGQIKLEVKPDRFIIEIGRIKKPKPSDSGRNITLATTHGFQPTAKQIDGWPIKVGVNVTHKNPNYVKPKKQ